ncbi:MAG: DUF4321 domain-containing protein [Ruminococcus sp.]|nr:DUF4321 domain-containing protein [Ruminococcus sp.]
MKKLYMVFLIAVAIIFGYHIGNAVIGTAGLSWLSYGRSFGFPNTPITFGGVINLSIGFEFSINVAQVLLIVTAIIVYTKTAPKLFA